jgi:hypothetical protein
MDNFKKVIKTRMLLLDIPVAFAVALGIYDVFLASPKVKDSFIFGFQCGAATACGLIAVILIFRYRLILKDEKKLKLEFNKENDERLKAIRAKAGLPMILATSVLMIIAGVIAAYFNATIFIALTAAAFCQMMISGIVKLIYMRKM